jgi:predicted nucleic acid-binding protein
MESKLFFTDIQDGKFILVISATTLRELERAPSKVQKVLNGLPPTNVEIIESSDEISFLRDKYLEAGILDPESDADAEHIASASVADVDFVVSWNLNTLYILRK